METTREKERRDSQTPAEKRQRPENNLSVRLKEELDTICQTSRETILRKIEQPRHTSKPKNVQTKHRSICNINVLTLDRQKSTRRNTFVNSENYIVKSNTINVPYGKVEVHQTQPSININKNITHS